jgi:hypothetical protein
VLDEVFGLKNYQALRPHPIVFEIQRVAGNQYMPGIVERFEEVPEIKSQLVRAQMVDAIVKVL